MQTVSLDKSEHYSSNKSWSGSETDVDDAETKKKASKADTKKPDAVVPPVVARHAVTESKRTRPHSMAEMINDIACAAAASSAEDTVRRQEGMQGQFTRYVLEAVRGMWQRTYTTQHNTFKDMGDGSSMVENGRKEKKKGRNKSTEEV